MFLVLEANNCSVEANDLVKIMRLEYGYPFVCESVERSGKNLGAFVSINEDIISAIEEKQATELKNLSKNGIK
jgi:hypothetical protein